MRPRAQPFGLGIGFLPRVTGARGSAGRFSCARRAAVFSWVLCDSLPVGFAISVETSVLAQRGTR